MKEASPLSGFNLSPNPEVADLEGVLGIKFVNPPARIELTLGNRIAFVRRTHSLRPLSGTAAGTYHKDLNAFVVRPGEKNRLTAWHENMHGYIEEVNPEESYSLADLRVFLLDSLHGLDVGRDEVEEVASVTALDEGLSEWSAVHVALGVGNAEEKKEAGAISEAFSPKRRLSSGRTVESASFKLAHRSISALTEVFSDLTENKGRFKAPIIFNRMVSSLHDIIYTVGFNFVDQAIESLMRKGKSLGAAINFLILNPPHSVDELRNPRKFVFDKLR